MLGVVGVVVMVGVVDAVDQDQDQLAGLSSAFCSSFSSTWARRPIDQTPSL